jgi:seryl-tRNA synthetase
VKTALARRGAAEKVDELLELDAQRRQLQTAVEERRARRKQMSEQVAKARRSGGGQDVMAAVRDRSSQLGEEIKGLEQELAAIDAQLQELLASLPNLPDPSAPDGDS